MFSYYCTAVVLLSYISTATSAALICGATGSLGFVERDQQYVANLEGCLDQCLSHSECLSYQYVDDGSGFGGACSVSVHTVANSDFQPSADSSTGVVYDLDCQIATTGTRPAQAAPTCGVCAGGGCQKKMLRKRGSGAFASAMQVAAANPAECLTACRANSAGDLGCNAIFFSFYDDCEPSCSLLLGTQGDCEVRSEPDSQMAYFDINCPPQELSFNCGGASNTCLPTTSSSTSTSSTTSSITQSISPTTTHPSNSTTSSTHANTGASVSYPTNSSNSTKYTKHPTYPSSRYPNSSLGSYTRSGYPSQYSTSTIYATSLVTITACSSSVYNCPASARYTTVVTETMILGTTVCPVAGIATDESPASSYYMPVGSSPYGLNAQTVSELSSAPSAMYPYATSTSPISIPGTNGNGTGSSPAQYTGAGSEAATAQVGFFCAAMIIGVLFL